MPAPGSRVRHCMQISTERASELDTAVAAAADASPTDSLVLSPRTAAAVRNPAMLASQVLRLTLTLPASVFAVCQAARNTDSRLPLPCTGSWGTDHLV